MPFLRAKRFSRKVTCFQLVRARLRRIAGTRGLKPGVDGLHAKSDRLSRTRSRHAKHLLLQWFGQQRFGYIACGIVVGRMQNPLETVFGSVRWVSIPNDDPAGPRFCRTKLAQGRTRRYLASWLLQL